MSLSINVKPDSTSKAQEVKRTAAAQRAVRTEWICDCPRHNGRYLNNCLDCGVRRESGKPVDD